MHFIQRMYEPDDDYDAFGGDGFDTDRNSLFDPEMVADDEPEGDADGEDAFRPSLT